MFFLKKKKISAKSKRSGIFHNRPTLPLLTTSSFIINYLVGNSTFKNIYYGSNEKSIFLTTLTANDNLFKIFTTKINLFLGEKYNFFFTQSKYLGAAVGSYVVVTQISRFFTYLMLPSGFLKKFSTGFINPKYFIFKKKKKSVRGIAKNPVDHPNGGRANTKQPMKTP